MRQDLSLRLEQFKKQYVADEAVRSRIAEPPVKFIGDEIMELAVAALLQGENVLLSGGKATGKNILADNLAWLFRRPVYTVSYPNRCRKPARWRAAACQEISMEFF